MSAKKGPKKGSIAIPFLMTVLVSLVLLGGTAFFFLKMLTDEDRDEISTPSFTAEFRPGDEHSSTLMAVVDVGSLDTDLVFVLIRSIPKDLKMVTMVVPTTSQIAVDSTSISLASIYRAEGIEKTQSVIESQFGITIDKYAKLDAAALERIHNILGGVTVNVPQGIPDMVSGRMGLNAAQMIKLLTYPDFAGGEHYRTSFASTLASTMLNYGFRSTLVSRLDFSFESLIDLLATNITYADYERDKNALIYMLENRIENVQIRVIPGEWIDGEFHINSSAEEIVGVWFEVNVTE